MSSLSYPDNYFLVVSTSPEQAREFFGGLIESDAVVEDIGPPRDPKLYKEGSRVYRIYKLPHN